MKIQGIEKQLKFNKIIMESFESLSKKLSTSISPASITQYQKNVRQFISSVQKEIDRLIKKYEKKIKVLKDENGYLKKQINPEIGRFSQEFLPHEGFQCLSPIKKMGSSLFGLETVHSNLKLNPYQNIPMQEKNHRFQIERNLNQQFSKSNSLVKSRFQVKNRNQGKRQQELIESLEMGKSNLNLNTTKMFKLLGKQKMKNDIENQEQECFTPTRNKKNQMLNTSLSSLCQSLDNSFHSKKSRAKKIKKQKKKEFEDQNAEKKKIQQEKSKKEQGVKNLLESLRNNMNSSSQQSPEVIKGSKLLNTGEKCKIKQSPIKSKVLINPIPIDVNRMKESKNTTMSPKIRKNPTSILKNSSNILSRSISNISAISFHSSGGQ